MNVEYVDGVLRVPLERGTLELAHVKLTGGSVKGRLTATLEGANVYTNLVNLTSERARAKLKEEVIGVGVCGVTDEVLRSLELAAHQRPSEQPAAEPEVDAASLERVALTLLRDPNLIHLIEGAIRSQGYAGPLTPAMCVYFIVTSRLLVRPMHGLLIGPSANGKTYAADTALNLFPASAYYRHQAGSERALVYLPLDTFERRALVIFESDSLPEDGPIASALRGLLSDGHMEYSVPVEDPETNEYRTLTREFVGPTPFLTTSTRPLPEQWSTRALTLPVPESAERTRQILQASANAVNGHRPVPMLEQFVVLQQYLQYLGPFDVMVPFSHELAKLMPTTAARVHRDFQQLLTMIQASAVLHLEQRERLSDGRIVASWDDYEVARRYLKDIFDVVSSGGVTDAVREVVGAVDEILGDGSALRKEHATRREVAQKLAVADTTAGYRIDRALKLELLVNDESRPRQPAKLRLGAPVPPKKEVLPPADSLRNVVTDPDFESEDGYEEGYEERDDQFATDFVTADEADPNLDQASSGDRYDVTNETRTPDGNAYNEEFDL